MKLEYIGELMTDGHLSVAQAVLAQMKTGEKVRIKLEPVNDGDWEVPLPNVKDELDADTRGIMEAMDNAPFLGAPDDPEQLGHSLLFEVRMEDAEV